MKKYFIRKFIATLLIGMMLCSICGCGQEEAAGDLPSGVVRVKTPEPSKEKLLVEQLTGEALRRYAIATAYNNILKNYDCKKGNKDELVKLIGRVKKYWQEARDASSIALLVAMKLNDEMKYEDYSPYKEAMLLENGVEFSFVNKAYAEEAKNTKDNKNTYTKEEIYAKDNKVSLKKYIDSYPEEKQLLAIAKGLHTTGQTACEIMADVYPERVDVTGRSWADVGADAAYRAANVTKTAGKMAGVAIAVLTMPVTGGLSTALCAGAGLVKICDTTVDIAQTATIVMTGEECETISKIQSVTGTADTVCGILTFSIRNEAVANSLTTSSTELAKMVSSKASLKEAVKYMQVGTAVSTVSGLATIPSDADNAYVTISGFTGKVVDGLTAAVINPKLNREDLEKLEALGESKDNFEKAVEASQKAEEIIKNTSTAELISAAEEMERASTNIEAKGNFDAFVSIARTELAKSIFGPNATADTLDNYLTSLANAYNQAVANVNVQQEKIPAPYAIENVVGTYKAVPVDYGGSSPEPVDITVRNNGGKLTIVYTWYLNGEPRTTTVDVASYDENTGVGTVLEEGGGYRFTFSGQKGNISIKVNPFIN